MNKRIVKIFGLIAVASLGLTGCSGSTNATGNSDNDTLIVGASPVPHGKILEYIAKELAPKAGLKLEIKQYTDYVQPNTALDNGDIDANFYQHLPYLKQAEKDNGYKFTAGKGVHLEPYGIYSEKIKSLKDLPENAKVGITNDPSNQGRALLFLEAQGLIKVDSAVKDLSVHKGIVSNPKKLQFVEADPATLPRTISSLDIAVINGNFALEAGLSPNKDAIALEDGKNNPYSNLLVRRSDLSGKKLEAWNKLEKLLHSPEVKKFITDNWSDGSIIPSF